MKPAEKTTYAGGRNIAMKVPPENWEPTVVFYRDVVGLREAAQVPAGPGSMCFEFGCNRLWIDAAEGLDRTEIWLELITPDLTQAAAHLHAAGTRRRDEVEALPPGFEGFWIENPASVIHLVAGRE